MNSNGPTRSATFSSMRECSTSLPFFSFIGMLWWTDRVTHSQGGITFSQRSREKKWSMMLCLFHISIVQNFVFVWGNSMPLSENEERLYQWWSSLVNFSSIYVYHTLIASLVRRSAQNARDIIVLPVIYAFLLLLIDPKRVHGFRNALTHCSFGYFDFFVPLCRLNYII